MPREYIRPAPLEDVLAEHIDEAAFLYQCRRRVNSGSGRSWEDLRDYEKRMLPHIHGLVLGGTASAGLLKGKLTLDEDGDPGETFVAAVVYPMLGLIEPMEWLLEAIAQKPPHLRAIVDGLKLSKGRDLEGWLEFFIGHPDPVVRAVGAEVIGYRGIGRVKGKMLSLREDRDPAVALAAMEALAGSGIEPLRQRILQALSLQDSFLFLKAVELLLKTGDLSALSVCRARMTSAEPADVNRKLCLYLAISGTVDDVAVIQAVMQKQPDLANTCLLAMGLCGSMDSCDLLIGRLDKVEDLESFTSAYQGLRLMTGLDYLPPFDTEEAKPEEILQYQGLWKDWRRQNPGKFSGKLKWRRGERISPTVLYKDLLWRGHPCRDLACLELVIRYGCPIHVQHDQYFELQAQQLLKLKQWVEMEDARFKPGLGYYFGKPLSSARA